MTTARDVIADWFVKTGFTPEQADTWAGRMMDHLGKAPESVRLELAAMLNPWRGIKTAPTNGRTILVSDGEDWWAIKAHEDGSHKMPDKCCKFWMEAPAPPSEDKPK